MTISIEGISNPSLNISTENTTLSSPLLSLFIAEFLSCAYSPLSPLYTAALLTPFSLKNFAMYSACLLLVQNPKALFELYFL